MTYEVDFDELPHADLTVDAIYMGGTSGTFGDDPLHPLLGVGNRGGFRPIGSPIPEGCIYSVLFARGDEPDWPDHLDPNTGVFTYFGDNRSPGRELHDTPRNGNRLLRHVFDAVHRDPSRRRDVPPFFVFEQVHDRGRDARFLGLAAPGAEGIGPESDLVAIWRRRGQSRFQNYRAVFTILDAAVIDRAWIESLRAGIERRDLAPTVWTQWVRTGKYAALSAAPVLEYRTKDQQLPEAGTREFKILDEVWQHFTEDPFAFEKFAAFLWALYVPNATSTPTRPTMDGGRDAIGELPLGPSSDPVRLSYALEAKCYKPGSGSVGVRDMARLISRLKYREFGVLVTTSFVARQAYKEIKEDGHPVTVISGANISEALIRAGYDQPKAVKRMLELRFPVK